VKDFTNAHKSVRLGYITVLVYFATNFAEQVCDEDAIGFIQIWLKMTLLCQNIGVKNVG